MDAPQWLQQENVWAYCLAMVGLTIWGMDRHRRWIEEDHARRLR